MSLAIKNAAVMAMTGANFLQLTEMGGGDRGEEGKVDRDDDRELVADFLSLTHSLAHAGRQSISSGW